MEKMHSFTDRVPWLSLCAVVLMRKVSQRPAWHLYRAAHKVTNIHIVHDFRLFYEFVVGACVGGSYPASSSCESQSVGLIC